MAYVDKYGAKFSDDKKELLKVPEDYKGVYEIPDGTIHIEPNAFLNCKHITTIVIPKTVEDIFRDDDFNTVGSCKSLSYFIVDSQNKDYLSIEGVLCEKGRPYVVAYPPAKKEVFTLPLNMQIGIAEWVSPCILSHIQIAENHPKYILEEGVLYNKKKDTLIRVSINKKEYIMPDSVKNVEMGAFSGCNKLIKLTFGASLEDFTDGLDPYQPFLDCISLRTIKVHPDNKNYYTKNGCLYEGKDSYGDPSKYGEMLFCPQAYKPVAFRMPDIDRISPHAFAHCKYLQKLSYDTRSSIPLCVGEDAFDGTPFYSNQENWENGILIAAGVLIKVSEEYKQNKLVIPQAAMGITVINSINNDHITEIEIEDGYRGQHYFNSGAINCPNLRTIKFPKTLSNWCLEEYEISLLEHCPKLEKILIPKGMRDFFLMYSNPNLHELMIEYDLDNNEIGKVHMIEQEKDFYAHIHSNGIPNHKQYVALKNKFQQGQLVTYDDILKILRDSDSITSQYLDYYSCDPINSIKSCFKKDGFNLSRKTYKSDTIWMHLYTLELDAKAMAARQKQIIDTYSQKVREEIKRLNPNLTAEVWKEIEEDLSRTTLKQAEKCDYAKTAYLMLL